MALYELRTFTLQVGRMAEATKLFQELGALMPKRGWDRCVVGFFQTDTGMMNQIMELLKFEDDADRRAFWATVRADPEFLAIAAELRPLMLSQEAQLLLPAPWGPHP